MGNERLRDAQQPPPPLAGRYEVGAELGRGGMGAVHRALDLATGQEVALKTLELLKPVVVAMFEREYRTLASLQHPRVISVEDYGVTEDGRHYYTMEILPGKDLAEVAPLPWREVCQHLRDVATCLALLHSRGLLHRDVSPKNVRFDPEGRAKLIDFGALCEFGVQKEVVGTAACMAPEVAAGDVLDGRTDVFALGVVAYVALTGRAPYSPSSVHAVEYMHQTTSPEPPSSLTEGIPPALDSLVMSMLALDRMERPAGAAEIIDRLNAIAGLEEDSLTALARSHLLSAPMVGRELERQRLRQTYRRVTRGQGGLTIVHGAQGNGRSRLLSEAAIDARIAGLTALRIDVLAHTEPLGVMRALAMALLRAAPRIAREALAGHIEVLGHELPDLAARAGLTPVSREPATRDPKERRVRLQNAMAQWVVEVARRMPLALVIDDVHALETTAAGCLVVLAHAAAREPLAILASASQDATLPPAVSSLERLASRVDLNPLEFEDVDELLTMGFGDVPYRVRVARWLYTVGHGNASHTFTLLFELLERQIIRYEGGTWVLPSELSETDLPQSIVGVLKARVAELSGPARQLAQTFALHRGSLPLDVVAKLLPELAPEAVSRAVDELVDAEVVVRAGQECRIAQESVRSLLMESMRGQTIRALHRALAAAMRRAHPREFRALRAGDTDSLSTDALVMALQVGWYMADGGQVRAGHTVLRDAAIALTVRGDGFVEAVPVLQRALASYRSEGRSRYEVAPLLILLTLAGTYADWRLTYSHGAEAMAGFCEASGLDRARRWSRWLGKRLALALSIPIAAVLFYCTARRRMTPTFRHLFLGLMGIGSAVFGAYVTLEDRERARKLREQLEPLGWFPHDHPVYVINRFQRALVENTLGNYTPCNTLARQALSPLQQADALPSLPDEARAQLKVGLCLLLGHQDTLRTDDRVLEILDTLESVPTSVSRQATAGLRAAYHAHRGESAKRGVYQDLLDMLAAQVGLTWREDLTAGRRLWATLAMSEDVVALKRLHRKFAPLVESVPSLRAVHDAVHAAYLLERGNHGEALIRYGSSLETAALEGTTTAMLYAAVYSRLLRKTGKPERALQVCSTALANVGPEDLEFTVAAFGAQLEQVHALVDMEQHARASEAASTLVQAQSTHQNPLLHGLAHGAAARAAMVQDDPVGFEEHLESMTQWLRPTDNPSLLAQCYRLAEEGRRRGLHIEGSVNRGSARATMPPGVSRVRTTISRCKSAGEKLEAALSLVVQASRVERGYLYLLRAGRLEIAAPRGGQAPPRALREKLEDAVLPMLAPPLLLAPTTGEVDNADEEPDTVVVASTPEQVEIELEEGTERRFHCLLLSSSDDTAHGLVGVIALNEDDEAPAPVQPWLLIELARSLRSATDVIEVYLRTTSV